VGRGWRSRCSRAMAVALVAALTGSSCREQAAADHRRGSEHALRSAGPSARLMDSTILQETDSEYIGKLGALAVLETGDFLVADLIRARILRFAPGGRLEGVIGQPGDGPGELRTPSAIALASDTLLLVADSRHGRIQLFDLRDGQSAGSVRLPGIVRRLAVRGDTVWIGTRDLASAMGMTRFQLSSPERQVAMLPFPAEYARSPMLPQSYSVVAFGLWGDTLVASFEGTGYWLSMSPAGEVRDTLRVPAVRRRGMPEDFVERLSKITTQEEQFALNSYAWDAHRMGDGTIALLYMDITFASMNLTMSGYLSLVSPDGRRACPDAQITFSPDGQPRIAWQGDTLLVAEQVVADSTRAVTTIKRYRIEGDQCEWIDMEN